MTDSQMRQEQMPSPRTDRKTLRGEPFFISLIVPIYDTPLHLLQMCLSSLSKQTLRAHEFEIILVDDASTNSDTIECIDTFLASEAKAKLVRRQENGGLNETRRSGLNAAKGNYVVFVDGDDFLACDALETLRMEASESGADVVSGPMLRWDTVAKQFRKLPHSARALPRAYNARLQAVFSGQNTFSMCGRLFARKLLSDNVFDLPRNLYHEDRVTFSRLIFDSERTSEVSKPIYNYSFNQKSISSNFSLKHAEDIFWVFEDWMQTARSKNSLDDLLPTMTPGFEVFVNDCLERCIFNSNLDLAETVRVIQFIHTQYNQSRLAPQTPSEPGTKLLSLLHDADFQQPDQKFIDYLKTQYAIHRKHLAALPNSSDPPKGLKPSDIARRTKDKIVLIGQVDYQLRNAAHFAQELRRRGHACVVLDNSAFVSEGRRQLKQDEWKIFWRTEHIAIHSAPYEVDWLSTAKLVITFNDFNEDFRDALEYRHRLGLPSVCMIEGINDFLRVDFESYRYLPYRRCDHVFLAGSYDEQFFLDRSTTVIGMPLVEQLSAHQPEFPPKPLAALNINFTYGAVENQRDAFLTAAKAAFEKLGWDWVITQHPEDQSDLSGQPVTELSQYELIEKCTVFVSRFATGILEALASGKPVIYFNPHGEKVEKFRDPLGAYDIATNEDELITALQSVLKQIESGVDFRKQAAEFLNRHASLGHDPNSAAERFADAAEALINTTIEQQDAVNDLFFESLDDLWPKRPEPVGLVFGQFRRQDSAQLNDEEMISHYFGDRGSIMIDVGANFGNSCDVYLGKGWTVHAFEPDPNNRKVLLDTWPDQTNLIVNEQAVSSESGREVPFYASDESTGISGLSAFTSGHKQVGHVLTTTLRDYYKKSNLSHVDFLKVDVEGFDKFVLDGFPWDQDRPDVVLAEFEDSKTLPLGYSAHDLAKMIVDLGYTVYISEWHSIVRYGIAHDWKRLMPYAPDLDLGNTWGNVIGFKQDPGVIELRKLAKRTLKFGAKSQAAVAQNPDGRAHNPSQPEPWYADLAKRVHTNSRLVFRALQFGLYCLRTLKRHPLLLGGGIVAGIIAPLLVAIQSSSSAVTFWGLGIAALSVFILSNLLVFAFARYLYLSAPTEAIEN